MRIRRRWTPSSGRIWIEWSAEAPEYCAQVDLPVEGEHEAKMTALLEVNEPVELPRSVPLCSRSGVHVATLNLLAGYERPSLPEVVTWRGYAFRLAGERYLEVADAPCTRIEPARPLADLRRGQSTAARPKRS